MGHDSRDPPPNRRWSFRPLHIAIRERHWDTIEYLVTIDRCSADQTNPGGFSPLHIGINERDARLMQLYLDCTRTKLDFPDPNGCSGLMRAAFTGQADIVTQLLAMPDRANINLQDPNGWTPLMWAVHGGDEGIVRSFLREVTVDMTKKTKDDLTVVGVSWMKPHFAIRRMLRGREACLKLMRAWVARIRAAWARETEVDEIDYDDF